MGQRVMDADHAAARQSADVGLLEGRLELLEQVVEHDDTSLAKEANGRRSCRAPLLLFDGKGNERCLLSQPIECEFVLLIHPVPLATLPNDALVISKVKPVQHEVRAFAERLGDSMGRDELK